MFYLDVRTMESRLQRDYQTSFSNCRQLQFANIQVWNFIPGKIGYGKWYDIKDYVVEDFKIMSNNALVRAYIKHM